MNEFILIQIRLRNYRPGNPRQRGYFLNRLKRLILEDFTISTLRCQSLKKIDEDFPDCVKNFLVRNEIRFY